MEATTQFGIGLRHCHFSDFIEGDPNVDFLEVISENYLLDGGKAQDSLFQIAEKYPIIPHGVSLSVGSTDPLDTEYLTRLKVLFNQLSPPWFSDHLCWTRHSAHYMHNLLPLPYTKETAAFVAEKAKMVQGTLGIPLILENVSSYIEFKDSTMTEWEFLSEVVERADCGILLDVNNIFVSARNHNFDPIDYLDGIDPARVKQFHVAGHRDKGDFILDTHDEPVVDAVWQLFEIAVDRFPGVPVVLERDDNIPSVNELVAELDIARSIVHKKSAIHGRR